MSCSATPASPVVPPPLPPPVPVPPPADPPPDPPCPPPVAPFGSTPSTHTPSLLQYCPLGQLAEVSHLAPSSRGLQPTAAVRHNAVRKIRSRIERVSHFAQVGRSCNERVVLRARGGMRREDNRLPGVGCRRPKIRCACRTNAIAAAVLHLYGGFYACTFRNCC